MKNSLAKIYGLVSSLERQFFAFFSFLKYRPAARVVSVGNLSMGGTGKTPVLFELLSELRQHSVCVLSRGYRSPWERSFFHLQGRGPHPPMLTDEAILLNAKFPEVPVFLGKNRHHSAIIAEKRCKPEIILLDDGFQYRRLAKDVDLVLFDAMASSNEAQLIPAGRLREPVERLQQAHAILLTRCETASEDQQSFWLNWLAGHAAGVPVIKVRTICEGLFDWRGHKVEITPTKGPLKKYFAFSAIGRPESFYGQLSEMGCQLAERAEFRDHHRFSLSELHKLGETAAAKGLQLVCTEKDFCKVDPLLAERYQIQTLRIRTLPASGQTFSEELAIHGISLSLPLNP
ncbi:MAG: tetraacyldisaccharide 4'-kinase [Candidatus Riflebacteria bacterium]|nr:tetraacyldisaccharide 4'-kinase [Candidatus Riflebacteria bacterium]